MKKRFIAVILACVLLMTQLLSCGMGRKPLTECGEEVISLMVQLLESDEYIKMLSFAKDYEEKTKELRDTDYSKSLAVYELTIPEEYFFDEKLEKEKLSEELYEYLSSNGYSSFASTVNNTSEYMVVSSIFAAQKCFADKSFDRNRIYLYVFENGAPIAISFVCAGDGVFKAHGNFILNDNFSADSEESIKKSCGSFGFDDVTVEKK